MFANRSNILHIFLLNQILFRIYISFLCCFVLFSSFSENSRTHDLFWRFSCGANRRKRHCKFDSVIETVLASIPSNYEWIHRIFFIQEKLQPRKINFDVYHACFPFQDFSLEKGCNQQSFDGYFFHLIE